MIALLQRVTESHVRVAGQIIARIGPGLTVLVAIEPSDSESTSARMAQRLLAFRVFADEQGRMNRSLRDIGGGLLLVPQFTLAADTRRGNRPSFSAAADPGKGRILFAELAARARGQGIELATGEFGADMQVTLTNDGPVTFWLQVKP
jgi:D-tyrosyl-tRNA(Tyr) deacylase